jgi:branched-chain amino acid transport system ATP-binding protein
LIPLRSCRNDPAQLPSLLGVEEGPVSSGQVRMLGKDVTGVSAEQTVAYGVVHVVEGRGSL